MKGVKKAGFGEFMFENGDYYVGNWENDYPSGEGLFIFENNTKFNPQYLAYLGTF